MPNGLVQSVTESQSLPRRRPLLICCGPDCFDPALLARHLKPDAVQLLHTPANLVPPAGTGKSGIESVIADALGSGGARDIIVCGHAGCAKLAAVIASQAQLTDPRLAGWVKHAEAVAGGAAHLPPEERLDWAVSWNVAQQLVHLRTHPAVVAGLATGQVRLFEWIYDPVQDVVGIPDERLGRRRAALDPVFGFLFRPDRVRRPTPQPARSPNWHYLA